MNTLSAPFSKKLIVQCFLLSFILHSLLLLFLCTHSLTLYGPLHSLFGRSGRDPQWLSDDDLFDVNNHNREIAEVFQQIVLFSPYQQAPFDLTELPQGIALAPHSQEEVEAPFPRLEEQALEIASLKASSPPLSSTVLLEEVAIPFNLEPLEQIQLPNSVVVDTGKIADEIFALEVPPLVQEKEQDLMAVLQQECIAFPEKNALTLMLGQKSWEDFDLLEKGSYSSYRGAQRIAPSVESSHSESILGFFLPAVEALSLEPKQMTISDLAAAVNPYMLPEAPSVAQWNDDFNVDLRFLSHPEGSGYIFSLSVSPKEKMHHYRMRQNIYFVLDRSRSLQRFRFGIFKRAVLKALASMEESDTFNIFIVDKKIVSFREKSSIASEKNFRAAEEFLEKQQEATLFHSGEIYAALEKLLPAIPENGEMHTIILLTNGKVDASTEYKKKILNQWLQRNHARVSLYAAAVGRDNDLVTLDLLSTKSGGRLLYSDTHASFPRKLAKLILDLKHPIAKDIVVDVVSSDPNAHIQLYPTGTQLPALYQRHPYTIYGEIDTPSAFDLVLQGRHKDLWIAIKKRISFSEGKSGDRLFLSQWEAQRAHRHYAKFLEEGKKFHLKIAKEIMKQSRPEVVVND